MPGAWRDNGHTCKALCPIPDSLIPDVSVSVHTSKYGTVARKISENHVICLFEKQLHKPSEVTYKDKNADRYVIRDRALTAASCVCAGEPSPPPPGAGP
jgi:hypothetical protein